MKNIIEKLNIARGIERVRFDKISMRILWVESLIFAGIYGMMFRSLLVGGMIFLCLTLLMLKPKTQVYTIYILSFLWSFVFAAIGFGMAGVAGAGTSVKNAFNRAVRKAGIEDFTFHSLRHTFASQLVRDGVDLYVVQKLLGHSSPKMTQRYAHLREDMLKDAIKKIDRQFEGVLYNTAFEFSTNLAHRDFQGDGRLEGISISCVAPKI